MILLGMKKFLGKWVPHILTDEQLHNRILCCTLNLRLYNQTKTLLKRTLSIDETWVKLYMEPDRNQQLQYLYTGEITEPTVHQDIHKWRKKNINYGYGFFRDRFLGATS